METLKENVKDFMKTYLDGKLTYDDANEVETELTDFVLETYQVAQENLASNLIGNKRIVQVSILGDELLNKFQKEGDYIGL